MGEFPQEQEISQEDIELEKLLNMTPEEFRTLRVHEQKTYLENAQKLLLDHILEPSEHHANLPDLFDLIKLIDKCDIKMKTFPKIKREEIIRRAEDMPVDWNQVFFTLEQEIRKRQIAPEPWILGSGDLRSSPRHPKNEDYLTLPNSQGVSIVSDGMGGHNNGEIASLIASLQVKKVLDDFAVPAPAREFTKDKFPSSYEKIATRIMTEQQAQELLREAIFQANEAVYENARKYPERSGMGATIVITYPFMTPDEGLKMAWGKVGDSRLYIQHEEEENLTRLGHDFLNIPELGLGTKLLKLAEKKQHQLECLTQLEKRELARDKNKKIFLTKETRQELETLRKQIANQIKMFQILQEKKVQYPQTQNIKQDVQNLREALLAQEEYTEEALDKIESPQDFTAYTKNVWEHRSTIRSAVGIEPAMADDGFEIGITQIRIGDIILATSDGVENLTTKEVNDILSPKLSTKNMINNILDMASERDKENHVRADHRDDKTVALLKIIDLPKKETLQPLPVSALPKQKPLPAYQKYSPRKTNSYSL